MEVGCDIFSPSRLLCSSSRWILKVPTSIQYGRNRLSFPKRYRTPPPHRIPTPELRPRRLSIRRDRDSTHTVTAPPETAAAADAAAHAAASINEESASPDLICEAVKAAAEENDIPIGFFVRLLWQESRFQTEEVSSVGAQGIAQFMPRTAVEMDLRDPFDPLQAIPASARFLRKLHKQFGNIGLAAAAYNAGGGRIAKWLARRGPLPKETRAYVKIITGHKAEAWTDEENTVYMPTDLPEKAPCEGVGGLSRQDQVAAVDVDLTPSASALVRKAEAAEIRGEEECGREKAARRFTSGDCPRRKGVSQGKRSRCPAGRKEVGAQAGETGRRTSGVKIFWRRPDEVIEGGAGIVAIVVDPWPKPMKPASRAGLPVAENLALTLPDTSSQAATDRCPSPRYARSACRRAPRPGSGRGWAGCNCPTRRGR